MIVEHSVYRVGRGCLAAASFIPGTNAMKSSWALAPEVRFSYHFICKNKLNSRSLHYAPPDFLLNFVTLANFMRLSLRKGAYAALSSDAWQEIRVRSGRDDNFV